MCVNNQRWLFTHMDQRYKWFDSIRWPSLMAHMLHTFSLYLRFNWETYFPSMFLNNLEKYQISHTQTTYIPPQVPLNYYMQTYFLLILTPHIHTHTHMHMLHTFCIWSILYQSELLHTNIFPLHFAAFESSTSPHTCYMHSTSVSSSISLGCHIQSYFLFVLLSLSLIHILHMSSCLSTLRGTYTCHAVCMYVCVYVCVHGIYMCVCIYLCIVCMYVRVYVGMLAWMKKKVEFLMHVRTHWSACICTHLNT